MCYLLGKFEIDINKLFLSKMDNQFSIRREKNVSISNILEIVAQLPGLSTVRLLQLEMGPASYQQHYPSVCRLPRPRPTTA